MPKLNIKELKKQATIVFETKKDMINFITKSGFKDRERLTVMRVRKKWIVWWGN